MNLKVFGLILIYCYVWVIETNSYSNKYMPNKFEEFLEKLNILRKGNKMFDIPRLDPFIMDKLPININKEMINLNATLNKIRVDGLSVYNVDNYVFKIFPSEISLNLTWPLVIASTNYNMKGKADDFNIYGKGDIKIFVKDLNVVAEVSFALKNLKYVEVKELKTQLSLRKLDFHATGLLNNKEISELLSAVISDILPQLIEDYQNEITEEVNAFITKILNNLLENKTHMEILKMLSFV